MQLVQFSPMTGLVVGGCVCVCVCVCVWEGEMTVDLTHVYDTNVRKYLVTVSSVVCAAFPRI